MDKDSFWREQYAEFNKKDLSFEDEPLASRPKKLTRAETQDDAIQLTK